MVEVDFVDTWKENRYKRYQIQVSDDYEDQVIKGRASGARKVFKELPFRIFFGILFKLSAAMD